MALTNDNTAVWGNLSRFGKIYAIVLSAIPLLTTQYPPTFWPENVNICTYNSFQPFILWSFHESRLHNKTVQKYKCKQKYTKVNKNNNNQTITHEYSLPWVPGQNGPGDKYMHSDRCGSRTNNGHSDRSTPSSAPLTVLREPLPRFVVAEAFVSWKSTDVSY